MKKLLLIPIFVFMAFTVQAQNDSAQLAQKVLKAIKSNDLEAVKNLFAPLSVYRKLYPKETKELTDAQMKEKTSDNPKLKEDFEALQQAAKEKKVNLEQLTFDSVKVVNEWGSDEAPWGMSIYYTLNGKRGEISVAALRHNGQWFFSEFLMPSNSFKEQ